jgi:hypothetical protein
MILNMAEEETAAVPEKGRRCLEKRRSLPKMLRKKRISTFKT